MSQELGDELTEWRLQWLHRADHDWVFAPAQTAGREQGNSTEFSATILPRGRAQTDHCELLRSRDLGAQRKGT